MKKLNDKGFTLVELIVVIAVLAVITVVAAPQYLAYVEKSRVGTDENALGEIAHIAEIEYVGLSVESDSPDDTVSVTIGANGTVSFDTNEDLDNAVEKVAVNYTFKSKTYKNKTITMTITNGVAKYDTIAIS